MADALGIVLAAGQGTRMKTDLPKVLVNVGGRPMILYVLDALRDGGVPQRIVVVGYRGDEVRRQLAQQPGIAFVEQMPQRGTGHAVMMCRRFLAAHDGPVVVLAGDSPLTQAASIRTLLERFASDRPACIVGTATREDPMGLGRIVRDADGEFAAIVEEKDASPREKLITEVNMSTYVFDSEPLCGALEQLTTDNAQGEYYITDCPGILKQQGHRVTALNVLRPCEALSINTLDELALVERELGRRTAD